MKFKAKIVVGVDFPGVGITRRNKEERFEASNVADAAQKAAAFAARAFPGDPSSYKSYQLSLAIDDGAAPAKDEPQERAAPASAAAAAQ